MANASTVPTFHSSADVHRYVREVASRKADEDAAVRRWQTAEQAILLVILVASFFIYYLLSIEQQIMTMPHVEVYIARTSVSR